MKRMQIIILLIAFIFAIPAISFSALPDTLDFGSAKFAKTSEKLFHEQIVHVCVINQNGKAYPSAIVFENRIVFYNDKGDSIAGHSFGPMLETHVTESRNGNYIYVFGPFPDKPGGTHRLYTFDGNVLLDKDTSSRMGKNGWGVPVEEVKYFISSNDGIVKLIGFDGQDIASKVILDPQKGENGDIALGFTENGSQIYAAANKTRLPAMEKQDMPILYRFDSRLTLKKEDTLSYPMVIDVQCSRNGKFLLLRIGDENGESPLLILDSGLHEKFRISNPQSVLFSYDDGRVFHVPRVGAPEILSTGSWQIIYKADIAKGFPWLDSDFSDRGTNGLLYDGNEIYFIDLSKQAWKGAPFPFAFQRCKLYNDGHRIILGGEFGYVIYDLLAQ